MNSLSFKTIVAMTLAALLAGIGAYLVQQREIQSLRATNEDLATVPRNYDESWELEGNH